MIFVEQVKQLIIGFAVDLNFLRRTEIANTVGDAGRCQEDDYSIWEIWAGGMWWP